MTNGKIKRGLVLFLSRKDDGKLVMNGGGYNLSVEKIMNKLFKKLNVEYYFFISNFM